MALVLGPNFGGLIPKIDAAQLPDTAAQVTSNVKLDSGAIRGWRDTAYVVPYVAVGEQTKSLYYDRGSNVWFRWDDEIDIVRGPVADGEANRRYYYTGDGVPKKTDSTLAIAGTGDYPRTSYPLAVPAPNAAPTLSNNNVGTGTEEDHVYVITYISTFSGITEESQPSAPVTAAAWQPGDTVTLSRADTVPSTHPNITHWRVYRSNGSSYLFVAEVVIATMSYADSLLNTAIGPDSLSTIDFDPPPNDMMGLVAMTNGMLAAFTEGGNEILFCEPYQPHAWPVKYRLPVNETIRALVPVGQGLYVLTDGNPYFGAGSHPSAFTMERISKFAPCLNKRTAVSDGRGAIYATYNGVAFANGNTVDTVTGSLFTQEEWETYAPSTMHGIFYDGRYMLWSGESRSSDFTMNGVHAMDGSQDMDGVAAAPGALIFNTSLPDSPLTTQWMHTLATHIRSDTGLLYVVRDGFLAKFDSDSLARAQYIYKSKRFVLPRPVAFKYIQVYAEHNISNDVAAAIRSEEERLAEEAIFREANEASILAGLHNGGWGMAAINGWTWNGSGLQTVPPMPVIPPGVYDTYLLVSVYAGGEMFFSTDVTDNSAIPIAPGGVKSDTWEIEISGNKPVRRVVMGTSIEDLRKA